jgi:hypothetical protein
MVKPMMMRTVLVILAGIVAMTVRPGAVPAGPASYRDHSPGAVRAQAQTRDAATVLREMRGALGADATLDAITRFTVGGSVRETAAGRTKTLSIDLSVLLPDHYLDTRRDSELEGPRQIDITYYIGFRGDTLIRRTESTIPFPPDPWTQTPSSIARREREFLAANRQTFARLMLILFGRAFSSYDLQFTHLGAEQREGRQVDVLEATGPDAYRMRVAIDAVTRLPAEIAYLARQPFTVSTSMTSIMRGSEVVRQLPPSPPPTVDVDSLPVVEHRLLPSEFKTQDGLTWPHRLTEIIAGVETFRIDLGKYRLNPKLDSKRFDVGR